MHNKHLHQDVEQLHTLEILFNADTAGLTCHPLIPPTRELPLIERILIQTPGEAAPCRPSADGDTSSLSCKMI